MNSSTRLPDQARTYGAAYAELYDDVFPNDAGTEATVDALDRLIGITGASRPQTIVEFGVGTGRIAIPLAARGAAVIGIDSSSELLAIAAHKRSSSRNLHLVHGDIRSPYEIQDADAVLCVCGTLSMLLHRDEQLAALRNSATMLRDGGLLIVETHNPPYVARSHEGHEARAVQVERSGTLRLVTQILPGKQHWRLDATHVGPEGEHTMGEVSRLTTPSDLTAMAALAGLTCEMTWSAWDGRPYESSSPMYVAVFRKAVQSTPKTD